MQVDLLYVAFNRLAYTKETFSALLGNTDWDLVGTLYVHDDGSTDGTEQWLHEHLHLVEADVTYQSKKLGGPVDAMNWLLDHESPHSVFGKVDNDMVVCPGWLNEMTRVIESHWDDIDILGMEPFVGGPTGIPDPDRTITPATHIGGKGLIKRRLFDHERMWADGYQGFTQWQHTHESVRKAWITPDIPVFGLDQLPFEPWTSLTQLYVDKGWHRFWSPYHPKGTYWDWWVDEKPLERKW